MHTIFEHLIETVSKNSWKVHLYKKHANVKYTANALVFFKKKKLYSVTQQLEL